MNRDTNYTVLGSGSRDKNLILLLLAALITLIFWGSIMALAKFALFLAVVYGIYIFLKSRF